MEILSSRSPSHLGECSKTLDSATIYAPKEAKSLNPKASHPRSYQSMINVTQGMTSKSKTRITVTVDPALLKEAIASVKKGAVSSLSAWVNEALSERVAAEKRLSELNDAVKAFEAKTSPITEVEMRAQIRKDRESAVVVRRVKRKRRAA